MEVLGELGGKLNKQMILGICTILFIFIAFTPCVSATVTINEGITFRTSNTSTIYYMNNTFNFTNGIVNSTHLSFDGGSIITYPNSGWINVSISNITANSVNITTNVTAANITITNGFGGYIVQDDIYHRIRYIGNGTVAEYVYGVSRQVVFSNVSGGVAWYIEPSLLEGVTLTLVYPENGSTVQDLTMYIIVRVIDENPRDLNVTFYNAETDEALGYSIVNGSDSVNSRAGTVWRELEHGNNYTWYARAGSGYELYKSNEYYFTCNVATRSESRNPIYLDTGIGGLTSIQSITQFANFIMIPLTNAMGSWIYVIFVFASVGLSYLKTQQVFIPSIMLLFMGVFMAVLLPQVVFTAIITMIALGFTGIIYHVFHNRL